MLGRSSSNRNRGRVEAAAEGVSFRAEPEVDGAPSLQPANIYFVSRFLYSSLCRGCLFDDVAPSGLEPL